MTKKSNDPEAKWIEERERQYLESPSRCPICKSSNISAGSMDMGEDAAWQYVDCSDCGAEWTDIYHLKEVTIESYPTDYFLNDHFKTPKNVDPNEVFKRE